MAELTIAPPTAAERDKLTRAAVWAFGFVALPLSTIGLPLAIYLAPFYAGEVGLSLAALGTAMLFARVFDVVVDPFIGSMSDRWPTRFGRRRPWLVAGSLMLMLGTMMLFHPPKGVSLSYFFLWLAVMYGGFSLLQVPHRAWGAELSPDYHERTHISTVRQFFSTAGLIVSTLVPALVLGRPGATSADVLSALAIMMLIVLPIAVVLNLVFTPEPKMRVGAAQASGMQWRAQWRAIQRNGPLRTILLVLFIGFSAETFRQTLTVFFARDVIGVPNLGLFFLSRGDVALFTLMFIVKGFCFGALDLLPAAMLADAADVDTAVSRKYRAGLLFAMAGVVTNLGQAVGQGVSLHALGWVGYRAAGETDPAALDALRWLYALAPSLVLGIAMLLALRYSLTAARHAKLRVALERRRAP